MAIQRWVKDGDSFELKSNRTFYTDTFPPEFDSNIVVCAAYDANGDILTAAAGTITISASPIDGQWVDDASAGANVIELSEAGSSATYSMPEYEGSVIKVRAVISGVNFSIVDHVKIQVWSK